ncbi:hypothetical protein C8R44DRAFT_736596 [Mycena epipterygia]|nr:hypothetical protein C8R44DRAFT_736596 [Mycena epipterygia]
MRRRCNGKHLLWIIIRGRSIFQRRGLTKVLRRVLWIFCLLRVEILPREQSLRTAARGTRRKIPRHRVIGVEKNLVFFEGVGKLKKGVKTSGYPLDDERVSLTVFGGNSLYSNMSSVTDFTFDSCHLKELHLRLAVEVYGEKLSQKAS